MASPAKTKARRKTRSPRSRATPARPRTFQNFIAGQWVPAASRETFLNVNPGGHARCDWDIPPIGRRRRRPGGRSPRNVASSTGGARPAPARGDVLRRAGDILARRKDELAELMTREMGKPLAETRGDVQEGIDTAYYAATMGRQLLGHTVPSELRAKWAMSYRRPIGVCGIVTPFNFPLAIPTWKMFPALVCGNACVFKPAEDVPHTATVFVEILLEAGLPPDVVQLVHGDAEAGARDRRAPGGPRGLLHRVDRNGPSHR